MFKLSGLIPAVFTPFKEDGSVDYSVVGPYAEKIVADGAYGVFVCGSTGECSSMTVEERKRLLDAWVKAVDGRILVVAHVGSTCQKDSIELADHALRAGVDAVGAVAPHYLKPSTVEDLVACYKPVAAACAPLPFYAYHIPSMTGINVPMKGFLEQGAKEIPNLNGIKFTSNNFMEMLECVRLDGGRFDILNGFDEMLLCGMAVGVRGGVGSTYNYSLKTYQKIYDAFLAGDLEGARKAQQESVDIVRVIINHGGGIRGGKAIMKLVGIDCGNCRSPLSPYTEAEIERIAQELDAIGFER